MSNTLDLAEEEMIGNSFVMNPVAEPAAAADSYEEDDPIPPPPPPEEEEEEDPIDVIDVFHDDPRGSPLRPSEVNVMMMPNVEDDMEPMDEEPDHEPQEESMRETFSHHAHYTFDNWMAKTYTVFIGLAIICIFIVAIGGTLNYLAGGTGGDTVLEGMWLAWGYMADPGNQADAEDVARLPAAVISVSGVFFSATLLGFVVDAIRSKMEQLRKGKSMVMEKEHTLILGWTDKMFSLIKELCNANECRADGSRGGHDNDSPRLLSLNQSPPSLTVPFSLRVMCRSRHRHDATPCECLCVMVNTLGMLAFHRLRCGCRCDCYFGTRQRES